MFNDDKECDATDIIKPQANKNWEVQLVLSLSLGLSAFLVFCVIRPRWPSLYAARKRRLDPSLSPPALPDSTFGWIPRLLRITEEEVLATAGLDAFVFLAFFKMATRLFALMAFLATAILLPINTHFDPTNGDHKSRHDNTTGDSETLYYTPGQIPWDGSGFDLVGDKHPADQSFERSWLWAHVFMTYLFVALTIYSLNWETFRIIRYRQDYLGTQCTVTDRTFRLTGIPADLRSGDRIKHLIEKLNTGGVQSVTVCRDWCLLDSLVARRDETLRKLEAAWADWLKSQRKSGKRSTPRVSATDTSHQANGNINGNGNSTHYEYDDTGENGRLLPHMDTPLESDRPTVRIPYGFLGLRHRRVDAIDYYEEKLRRYDARIIEARKKEYSPTDTALVTMDSVAACQMLIQARIDPRPGRLLTKTTPAPSDLVWKNTYALRGIRRLKSWAVTLFITILTVVWIFPTAFLASFLSICTIKRVAPEFGDWLQSHYIIHSLLQNGLPTLVVSLLNVAVPYLYDWLSNCQGMISQGDVELSVISKNFFFTFFNTFFVFAISLAGLDFWSVLQEMLKDTSGIPRAIAGDVEALGNFYICFVMLQGIGLMPFRILEVGSVFLYPFYRMTSKTPRDFEELKKPPIFQYGFYLPTALLIFNLCLIYSVLSSGYLILIVGTVYFALGYFTFKYMVLYAMNQPQHATGGAWRIICYRIIVGLAVFEVVMIGSIATKRGFIQSVAVAPLIPFTTWYSYYIKQRFEPLTNHIALRAIRADEDSEDSSAMDDAFHDDEQPRPSRTVFRRGSTLDEHKEKGLTFSNPSLVAPLQRPWIYEEQPPSITEDDFESSDDQPPLILRGADSTLGLGDDNVWTRDSRENIV